MCPTGVRAHAGLACSCAGWRWQLQDLVAQHVMLADAAPQPRAGCGRGHDSSSSGSGDAFSLPATPQGRQHGQPLAPPSAPAEPRTPSTLPPHSAVHSGRQQLLVLTLDNRGMGRSSSPRDAAQYSTQRMAADVVAVMVRCYMQRRCAVVTAAAAAVQCAPQRRVGRDGGRKEEREGVREGGREGGIESSLTAVQCRAVCHLQPRTLTPDTPINPSIHPSLHRTTCAGRARTFWDSAWAAWWRRRWLRARQRACPA